MKSHTQRMESSGIADRLSLVAHDHMIRFYEAIGFVNKGASQCEFGAGGWFDMVCVFRISCRCRIMRDGSRLYRLKGMQLMVIRSMNSALIS